MPWERYIYIDLLQNYLREQEEKRKDMEMAQKAAQSTMRRR